MGKKEEGELLKCAMHMGCNTKEQIATPWLTNVTVKAEYAVSLSVQLSNRPHKRRFTVDTSYLHI